MIHFSTDNHLRTIGNGLLVFALWGLFAWRLFRKNPGNRLVECGSITVIVFLAMIPINSAGPVPDWLFAAWLFLIILLCLATLFFLFQRMFRALARRSSP